jgi:hypothetical protein
LRGINPVQEIFCREKRFFDQRSSPFVKIGDGHLNTRPGRINSLEVNRKAPRIRM